MNLRFWQKTKAKGRSKEWLAGYAAGRRARNRAVPAEAACEPETGKGMTLEELEAARKYEFTRGHSGYTILEAPPVDTTKEQE